MTAKTQEASLMKNKTFFWVEMLFIFYTNLHVKKCSSVWFHNSLRFELKKTEHPVCQIKQTFQNFNKYWNTKQKNLKAAVFFLEICGFKVQFSVISLKTDSHCQHGGRRGRVFICVMKTICQGGTERAQCLHHHHQIHLWKLQHTVWSWLHKQRQLLMSLLSETFRK